MLPFSGSSSLIKLIERTRCLPVADGIAKYTEEEVQQEIHWVKKWRKYIRFLRFFSLSEVRWLKAKHTLNLSNRTESAGGPVSPHHLVGRVKVKGLYFLELFSTSSTKEEGIWPWSEALSGLAFQPTQGYSRFLKLLLLLLSSLMSDLWHALTLTLLIQIILHTKVASAAVTHICNSMQSESVCITVGRCDVKKLIHNW